MGGMLNECHISRTDSQLFQKSDKTASKNSTPGGEDTVNPQQLEQNDGKRSRVTNKY
jgi:hypothetical protein